MALAAGAGVELFWLPPGGRAGGRETLAVGGAVLTGPPAGAARFRLGGPSISNKAQS